jgi:hypothetical protein
MDNYSNNCCGLTGTSHVRHFASRCLLVGLIGIVGVTGVTSLPRLAHAQDTNAESLAEAKRLFIEATKDENNNEWAVALEKLMRIVPIKETAGIRYHIAYCKERLGRLLEAQADYRKAAQLSQADPENRSNRDVARLVTDKLASIGEKIPQMNFTIPQKRSGMEIFINGTPYSPAQLKDTVYFDTGVVTVKVKALRCQTMEERYTLALRSRINVNIALQCEGDVIKDPHPPGGLGDLNHPSATPMIVSGAATLFFGSLAIASFVRRADLKAETDLKCQTICDRGGREDALDRYQAIGLTTGVLAGVGAALTIYFAIPVLSGSKPANTHAGQKTFKISDTSFKVGPQGVWLQGKFLPQLRNVKTQPDAAVGNTPSNQQPKPNSEAKHTRSFGRLVQEPIGRPKISSAKTSRVLEQNCEGFGGCWTGEP